MDNCPDPTRPDGRIRSMSVLLHPFIVYPPAYHLTGSYLWQKGSIPGPAWKIPFIGPFLESVNPKFEEYKAKWASGELSCVSVFHK